MPEIFFSPEMSPFVQTGLPEATTATSLQWHCVNHAKMVKRQSDNISLTWGYSEGGSCSLEGFKCVNIVKIKQQGGVNWWE